MKHRMVFALTALAVFLITGLWSAALGQTNDGTLFNVGGGGSSIRFEVLVQNAGSTLTITAPDGRVFSKEFKAGSSPDFTLNEKLGLPDGNYSYELRLRLPLTPSQRDALLKARGEDDDPEAERAGRKRPVLPNMTQSGSFAVVNGQVVVAGLSEGRSTAKVTEKPSAPNTQTTSANTASGLRNHRTSLMSSYMFDIVQADDVIIQGSLCVGLDCVNNESFGFDTIRLKENNTRIKFDDTSTSAGFSANDWQLTANDSASGGASKFSIEDITGGRVPFTVTGGAPTNSIFVDSTGRLGLRTSTPVLDIHANTSNTPALRFEQNNSGGFVAQTWDVAGNEANFFVRDVTGGSRLPFRIRPGAPTSSIDISADGKVGIGIASPLANLSVQTADQVSGAFEGNGVLVKDDTTANSGVAMYSRGSTEHYIASLVDSSNSFLIFGMRKSSIGSQIDALTIRGSGFVGIGTTTPDQRLSVNGDADKVGGGSWLNFSDERLKNIKGGFKTGLKAIMQLQPIRYEYLRNNALGLKSDGEHIGLGAQSVEKIIPEAVTKNSEGYRMVNNDPIIWTMLNAIKEQQKEIEQLRGEIRKLRTASHRRRK